MKMMKKKKGFTLVELMIVLAIIAIIAAFAIPNLMRARMGANETAAVGALRTLMSAQAVYMNRHGRFGTLTQLGPEGAGLIDVSLATGRMSGYFFGEIGTQDLDFAYAFGAIPVDDGRSGEAEFLITQEGTVFENRVDMTSLMGWDPHIPTIDWVAGTAGVPVQFTTRPDLAIANWRPIGE